MRRTGRAAFIGSPAPVPVPSSSLSLPHDGDVPEIKLTGGFASEVVRIGETVRRTLSPNAGFVHELLDLFAQHDWAGAPRFLGIDSAGREMLTAGGHLAGSEQVVCHNDLSPKNTVYRNPGPRLHDVALMCVQYLDLGPGITETADGVHGLRLLCDAYGLADRGDLIETIMWWQDRGWREIEAAASAGVPGAITLRAGGVIEEAQAAWAWVAQHRPELEKGIRSDQQDRDGRTLS
jgi:hypothetical protein